MSNLDQIVGTLQKLPPEKLHKVLLRLPPDEKAVILDMLNELDLRRRRKVASDDFLAFVKHVWPGFIEGRHHVRIARLFEKIASGEIKRLILNLPPRSTKSEFGSYLFPAWFLGKFPHKQIIQASHTTEFATGFGRKVRNLIDSEIYHEIFPNVQLQADSKAAGRWNTNFGGVYNAVGVGSAVAGKGADLCLHSDTQIRSKRGVLPISKITVGDEVYGYDHKTEKHVWTRVRAIATSLKPELIKIGNLLCTPEHKVFTSKGYIAASRACDIAVSPMWKGLSAQEGEARKEFEEAWGDERQSGLLFTSLPTHKRSYNGKQGILFDGVFHNTEGEIKRLFRDMECRESAMQETGQGGTRVLRAWETTYGSASYRPRPIEQYTGESYNSLRPVPQSLSSSSLGACAEDFRELLQGEGYWVVDIQTDTHNFIADSYLTHNCIIDDPISERDFISGMHNPDVHNSVYEWYTSGPRQRLQPSGILVIIQTRWSLIDLTGQVLRAAAMRGSDEWTVVEFPAILPSGEALWPEYWPLEAMEAVRAEIPNHQWQAQYMQNPVSDSAAIIKREWWQWWEGSAPPKCEFVIQTWDTAHETKTVNDYSACTTWGVWYNEEDRNQPNIILLNAIKDRLEFPELKKVAYREWKEWQPDSLIIEKKAAGAPLIQEFRAMGIPVQEFSPGKGQDKISNLNAIADIFSSGKVWVPRTRWAEEVVDEVAAFPSGEHDDYCLIAGTKILMADGSEKAIETVVVGDLVMTHLGPNKVTASGATRVADTMVIHTDRGQLIGSHNHPIYTSEGWKRVDRLNPGDTIAAVSINGGHIWQLNAQEQIEKPYFSTGTHTKSIRIDAITSVLAAGNSYIEMFGNFIMDLYQRAITYITSMEMLPITTSTIYRCFPHMIINSNIGQKRALGASHLSSWSTSLEYAKRLKSGIDPKKVGHGIESTQNLVYVSRGEKTCSREDHQLQKFAKYVVKNFRRLTIDRKEYAQQNVARTNTAPENAPRNYPLVGYAKNAAESSFQYSPFKCTAQTSAKILTVCETGKREMVYNLTVDNAHTYYANGFLTHNCDTVALTLRRFRDGGYMTLPSDEPEPIQYFKSKHNKPYY